MIKSLALKTLSLPFTVLAAIGLAACSKKLSNEEINQLYQNPLPPVTSPLTVYHLGHSLVGKDMPAMLSQLAGEGHSYHSQLGWGATLQSHWEPDIPVNGFESENKHKEYRDPFEAIGSGKYDAFVMTEMVEIDAAVKYFKSSQYLAKFAGKVKEASPKTTIYFYETWHEVTDSAGWINRLDKDLGKYWEKAILHKALAKLDGQVSIYMIPAGQVLSAFFKEVERRGGVGNINKPEDIFARKEEDGSLDPIHINDMGNYLIALVHYATLYRKSPEGLSYELKKADGSNAIAPSAEAAALMQEITWKVVKGYTKTGVN
ncbi:MAG: hypothetical protein ACRBBR_13460 [Cellvibrionaceae bacterium]